MLLSLLAVGNVPYNFGEADKRPFLAENRANNNACPKATAILTNAPAFRFVLTLLLGLFERSRSQMVAQQNGSQTDAQNSDAHGANGNGSISSHLGILIA